MARLPRPLRPLLWVASSLEDLREFPDDVRDQFGYELFLAQTGEHPPSAKPFKGVGSGVVELIENHDGDTYRAVYTVRLATGVYVLHAFKKKSKQCIKTPPRDVELIKKRLKAAEDHDADERKKEGSK
jgi:phage-related protein